MYADHPLSWITDCGDMYDFVSKRGRLSEAQARWIFQQLMVAVDYLHQMVGIVCVLDVFCIQLCVCVGCVLCIIVVCVCVYIVCVYCVQMLYIKL